MNDHPGDLKPSIDAARAASLLQRLRDAAGRPGAAPSPETLAIQEALSRLAVIERTHLRGSMADAPHQTAAQATAPQATASQATASQATTHRPTTPRPTSPTSTSSPPTASQTSASQTFASQTSAFQTSAFQTNAPRPPAGQQRPPGPAVEAVGQEDGTRLRGAAEKRLPASAQRPSALAGGDQRVPGKATPAQTEAPEQAAMILTDLVPPETAGSGADGRQQHKPAGPLGLSRSMSEALRRALEAGVSEPVHAGSGSGVADGEPRPAKSLEARARLMGLIKPAATAGLVIIGLVFGVAGTWAALAPLAGAAIATGVVSPDGSRKTIQHLEGGIIKEILIREGDTVSAGQILYRLEVTQAQANYSARREQWLRLVATRARLDAHAQDAPRMTLPAEVTRPENDELEAFVENQQQLFELRRRGLEERENILRQQLRQLEEQTRGKRLENEGLDLQLKLLEEEAEDKATLVRQRLARKPEYLAIQRSIAEVKSRMGSNIATIGSLEERMGEIRLQVNAARTQFRDQNAELLMKTNNDLAQIEESLISTQDILRRTEIVAPASGTVLNMRFRTVGGVVRPGEPVVDLVPKEDVLVVDARLPATDIDVVRSGLPAMVHLVPYLTRDTPMLEGVVTHVGADSNVDQQTGQRFYEIKVRVDRSKLDSLGHTIELSPGMPVEVFVMTRNRTALGYMFEPLTRSFRRAFRED